MKSIKLSLVLGSALLLSCGTQTQDSSVKDLNEGQHVGSHSSWLTTTSLSKFENVKSWALESGFSYFPEQGWVPDEEILWTYDANENATTRDEVKSEALRNDKGPWGQRLADWFRYMPKTLSFPSPVWTNKGATSVQGLYLLQNFSYLAADEAIKDEIYLKTFVRAKGNGNQGSLTTKLVVLCNGTETVTFGNEVIKDMPKPVFTEVVSEQPDPEHPDPEHPNSLALNTDWSYLRSDVRIRTENYENLNAKCKAAGGTELIGYVEFDIKNSGNAVGTTQFLATEIITSGDLAE